MIDYDALQAMFDEEPDSKQKKLDGENEKRRRLIVRQENNTRKILSTVWGREWLWEFYINAAIVNRDPYTGNASTYYIVGLQRQAKDAIAYLKNLDFSLYQKMEKEAYNRKKKEDNE